MYLYYNDLNKYLKPKYNVANSLKIKIFSDNMIYIYNNLIFL